MTEEERRETVKNLDKTFFSIYEAAEICDVHDHTIRNHIKAGLIKAGKCGRQWRIAKADLLRYITPQN